MCGFRQFVCWCCLWEVILFFIYFLLKRALLLICYCCSLFIIVLYVITQRAANEICCINKSALLWSFCILTDSLIIVKHCTRLHIQKNDANMPFCFTVRAISDSTRDARFVHCCCFCLQYRAYDSCTKPEPKLTHGTVGSHPVGITAAQPSVWNKGAVTVALVWALGPGQLAVDPPPAWLAVALPVHTDAIVRTRGIQTIHCIKQEVNHMKRQSLLIKKGKNNPPPPHPQSQKMSN